MSNAPPSPKMGTADDVSAVQKAAATQIISTDEFTQYLLKSKTEMFSVFRGMVDAVSQVTMFFNESKDMLLTSVVSYSDNGIVLDFGASSESNRRALSADKLFCVALLDKVKIQFILRGVRQIDVDGRPAFLAALPENVLRLQRREYFRLTMPIVRPLKCLIPYPMPDGKIKPTEIAVADISGGGLGLTGIPESLRIEKDMEFTGCKIELPEVGVVTVNLRVHNVFETVTRSGVRTKRAGCEFNRLAGSMLTLIQRYIIKIERERKARESGLT